MGFHSFWALRESASTDRDLMRVSPRPSPVPQSPVFPVLVLRMKSAAQRTVGMDAFVLACSGGRSVLLSLTHFAGCENRPASSLPSKLYCTGTVSVAASGPFSQNSASSAGFALSSLSLGPRPGSRTINSSFANISVQHMRGVTTSLSETSSSGPNPSPKTSNIADPCIGRLRPRLVTPLPTSRLLSCQVRPRHIWTDVIRNLPRRAPSSAALTAHPPTAGPFFSLALSLR
ncbi:hypothetical protein J3F83DRAFT_93734 [Trichoderma novae-zelandiae]